MGFWARRSFWFPLIVVTLSAAALSFVIARRRGELAALKQKQASLEVQLASLRQQNASLRRERTQLLCDAAAVERVARDHYGFLAPGEIAVSFAPPRQPAAPAAPALRSVDRWDHVLGCGEFPWKLPLAVCALSAVVLGALDVISASRKAERGA